MATFGLGNFKYDLTVDGGSKFHWYDPEDATNTADVTIDAKEFPEGVKDGDARQVADLAYQRVSKELNDKRDQRIKREAAEQLDKQINEDARVREATADFIANSKEQSDTTSDVIDHDPTGDDQKDNGKKKS